MQVTLPPSAVPGSTISVQHPQTGQQIAVTVPPGTQPGSTISIGVPGTSSSVVAQQPGSYAPVGTQVPPERAELGQAVTIKQEVAVIEFFGCEARNRYRVHQSSVRPEHRSVETPQLFYISEESKCCERICCGPQRTLTLRVHQGYDRKAPVWLRMHKPCHLQGNCCCLRPELTVMDNAYNVLGKVEDPCACCRIDQKILDASANLKWEVYGSICQCGLCCPCCGDVVFEIKPVPDSDNRGEIRKIFDGASEMCLRTNKFKLTFPSGASEADKILLFGSTMLVDLEYFEMSK